MKICIINGPNLNLLGKREPEVYGSLTFEEYFTTLQIKFPTIEFAYFQSNIEGELIDKIQEFGFTYDGIILNANDTTPNGCTVLPSIAYTKTVTAAVSLPLS